MPKCVACDSELSNHVERMNGYCESCQREIRTVFDKDAYALGQYKDGVNQLAWTLEQDVFVPYKHEEDEDYDTTYC